MWLAGSIVVFTYWIAVYIPAHNIHAIMNILRWTEMSSLAMHVQKLRNNVQILLSKARHT